MQEKIGKNRPEAKFTAGAVSATVWKNSSQEAEFNTISLGRSYKDKAGKWQNTQTLRINDLPKARLVLDKAYDYLLTHRQEANA